MSMKVADKPLAIATLVAGTLLLGDVKPSMPKRSTRHNGIDHRYVRQLEERVRRLEYFLAALTITLLAAALQALLR